jgi:hypothetical protein
VIIPKERIFLTGDVMTKYEEARLINRAVKKSLKRQLGQPVYRSRRYYDLPAYVTDNPFYP